MALRAGYYGLKRFERNKLLDLAASIPADIGPDNPIASKSDISATVDLLKDTTGWLGGNKWNNDVRTASVSGITGNVNSNEQIVLTGSFTGAEPNVILFGRISLKKGTYKLTGNDGSNNKIALQAYKAGVLNVYDYGNGGEFTLNADTSDILLRVYLNVGATIDTSLTFSPMLLTSEEYAISPSYRPSHESVEEMLTPKLLTSANDLDDVKTGGDYYWTQSYPTHSPENNTFGALRVFSCGEVIYQMVIRGAGSSASIYIRRFQETWSNWFIFSGTEIVPASLTKEEETKKVTKKKVIKEEEE